MTPQSSVSFKTVYQSYCLDDLHSKLSEEAEIFYLLPHYHTIPISLDEEQDALISFFLEVSFKEIVCNVEILTIGSLWKITTLPPLSPVARRSPS
jgi:hypothetical protein